MMKYRWLYNFNVKSNNDPVVNRCNASTYFLNYSRKRKDYTVTGSITQTRLVHIMVAGYSINDICSWKLVDGLRLSWFMLLDWLTIGLLCAQLVKSVQCLKEKCKDIQRTNGPCRSLNTSTNSEPSSFSSEEFYRECQDHNSLVLELECDYVYRTRGLSCLHLCFASLLTIHRRFSNADHPSWIICSFQNQYVYEYFSLSLRVNEVDFEVRIIETKDRLNLCGCYVCPIYIFSITVSVEEEMVIGIRENHSEVIL
ncbi:hypothetical protein K501DRAFT_274779 [Backusella circina FSU 941]|nr:hypothetical protein K501DRAFT_274779 [Backusella circina FSU 941]